MPSTIGFNMPIVMSTLLQVLLSLITLQFSSPNNSFPTILFLPFSSKQVDFFIFSIILKYAYHRVSQGSERPSGLTLIPLDFISCTYASHSSRYLPALFGE